MRTLKSSSLGWYNNGSRSVPLNVTESVSSTYVLSALPWFKAMCQILWRFSVDTNLFIEAQASIHMGLAQRHARQRRSPLHALVWHWVILLS